MEGRDGGKGVGGRDGEKDGAEAWGGGKPAEESSESRWQRLY